MNKRILSITPLEIPEIISVTASLSHIGRIGLTDLGLTYLDIDDEYIHRTFQLIGDQQATKPDYFDDSLVGAHISVIYPEEGVNCHKRDLNQEHSFSVSGIFTAILGGKRYYALKVKAPTLIALRRGYGLPSKLYFKEHWVDLHITVGVAPGVNV